MARNAQSGSFDELVDVAEPRIAQVARLLRALILAVHPDAVEVVRLGDRAASYGLGPKKMSEAHTYIMPQRTHVNLGLYQGARLPDPEGLLEGEGKLLRHVKLRSAADVERPALRRLIEASLVERRCALGRA